jgi:diadenosine tetraphosphate (Ap4A) HIT family hydrolase
VGIFYNVSKDMKEEYVDVNETRTPEQRAQYEEINRSGKNPFSYDEFLKIHKSPILKQNDSWLVTKNDTPYEGTVHHFLFVYKGEFTSKFSDLPNQHRLELFELYDWVNETYQIESGAFLMRYGGHGNGSSVRHLHAHVIVGGNDKSKNPEGIKVKVGYKK